MTDAPRPLTLLLTAGEASGDRLGAELMQALKAALPDRSLRFIGVGGAQMAGEGLKSLFNLSQLSVLGLFEGLKAWPMIVARAKDVAALAAREKPDAAILIDSWGFSLRVATRIRKASPGTRLLKYVGPQIWASRPGRARVLAAAVDRLLSTQSMDAPFYAPLGLPVSFVGNPVVARDVAQLDPARARAALGLRADQPLLLILPGSRKAEIEKLAEVFGEVAGLVKPRHPGLAVVVIVAPTIDRLLVEKLQKWPVEAIVFRGDESQKFDLMAAATVALAASGTVTTELGLAGAPVVVAYRVGALTALIAKRIVTTKWATLMNIALGREVVPEFIQEACTARALAEAIDQRLRDPALRARQVAEQTLALQQMGRGAGDPSARAAQAVIADLRESGKL